MLFVGLFYQILRDFMYLFQLISSKAVSEVSCSSSCVSLFFSDSVC